MPLIEDFNSYTNGDLNGQGSWSGSQLFDIQGTTVQEGAKAVGFETGAGGNLLITKDFTAETDGSQEWYIRAGQTNKIGMIGFTSNIDDNEAPVGFRPDGNISYYNGTSYVVLQAYSADTWYKMQAEWRSSDSKFRFSVNGGAWSAWDVSINTWANIDGIRLNSNDGTAGGDFYWDNFKAPSTFTPQVMIY